MDINHIDEELSQVLTLMVVSETGIDKTTLMNLYLIILPGVEISDKFRYKIKYEEPTKFEGQHKSLKSEVLIYKIRRPVGKPIIIVDKPEFENTSGIETDKNTVIKLKIVLLIKFQISMQFVFLQKDQLIV